MRRCLALFLLAMSSSCSSSSSPSRSFLVTGATEGLGLAAAKQLVKAGHTVLVHGRNAPKVDGVVRSLEASGGRAVGYVADLSSMAQVRQLGSEVAEAWPSLDGLLNNAGSFDGDYTGKRVVTDEGNEYTLAVNVLAPFLLTSLLLPSLRASGSGRVVISSSVSMGEAGSLDDLQLESGYSGHRAYSLSKLCDAMLSQVRQPAPACDPWSHVQGSISKTALAVTAKIPDPYRRRPRHERPVGLGRCRQADCVFRPSACASLGAPGYPGAWARGGASARGRWLLFSPQPVGRCCRRGLPRRPQPPPLPVRRSCTRATVERTA
jgi:hypothetical protein